MLTSDSRGDSPLTPQDGSPSNTIACQRKELAEMIGRLLAQTWLDQHRAAKSKGWLRSDPKERGR